MLSSFCLLLSFFTGCKDKVEQPSNHVPLERGSPRFKDNPDPDNIYLPAQPLPRVGDTSFYSAGGLDGLATGVARNNSPWKEAESLDVGGVNRLPQVDEESFITWIDTQHTKLLHLHPKRGLQILDISNTEAPAVLSELRLKSPIKDVSKIEYRQGFGYIFQPEHILAVDLRDLTAPAFASTFDRPEEYLHHDFGDAGTLLSFVPVPGSEGEEMSSWTLCAHVLDASGDLEEGECQSFESKDPPSVRPDEETWSIVTTSEESSALRFVDVTDPSGALSVSEPFVVEGLGSRVHEPFFGRQGNILSLVRRSNEVVPGSLTEETIPIFVFETYDITDISNPALIGSEKFGYDREMRWSVFTKGMASFGLTSNGGLLRVSFRVAEDGTISLLGIEDGDRPPRLFEKYQRNGELYLFLSRITGDRVNNGVSTTEPVHGIEARVLDGDPTREDYEEVVTPSESLKNLWSGISLREDAILIEEDVVSTLASDGTEERGAIIVPFHGYNIREQEPGASAFVFTYSTSTVTYRGLLPTQEASIRQVAFGPDGVLTTTSATGVRQFDLHASEGPREILFFDITPVYEDIWVLGDHAVRQRSPVASLELWRTDIPAWRRESILEVVRADGDIEHAKTLAQFSIPEQARVLQSGDLFVVMSQVDSAEPEGRFYIEVWDLSDPLKPTRRGSLQRRKPIGLTSTDAFPECPGCSVRAAFKEIDVQIVGDKLIFAVAKPHSESIGDKYVRRFFPLKRMSATKRGCNTGSTSADSPVDCAYQTGILTCSQVVLYNLSATPEVCVGQLLICRIEEGQKHCRRTTPTEIMTSIHTGVDRDHLYEWYSTELEIVDLSSTGTLATHTLTLPEEEQTAGWVSARGRLFVNFKLPHTIPGDGRAYMRYFTREIDLSDPDAPILGDPVNLPGRLVDVRGDTLLVHDYRWGERWTEGALHLLELEDGVATLTETLGSFGDTRVDQIFWLEDQSVYVTARGMNVVYATDVRLEAPDPYKARLMGKIKENGRRISTGLVDASATLLTMTSDKLVFEDAVVYDVSDRERPRPLKRLLFYDEIYGFDQVGDRLITAQGMYGLVSYDLGFEDQE